MCETVINYNVTQHMRLSCPAFVLTYTHTWSFSERQKRIIVFRHGRVIHETFGIKFIRIRIVFWIMMKRIHRYNQIHAFRYDEVRVWKMVLLRAISVQECQRCVPPKRFWNNKRKWVFLRTDISLRSGLITKHYILSL